MRYTAFVALLLSVLLCDGAAFAGSAGRCGGNGGSKAAFLSCPSGQYVVGLSAKGDRYVDRLGIRCAPFSSSGKRGAIAHTASAGGTGGTANASGQCVGNSAFIGLVARGDVWLDSIGNARCASRASGGGFEAATAQGSTLIEFNIGGYGGKQCSLRCPAGEAIYEIRVRYGAWIDSIEVLCRR